MTDTAKEDNNCEGTIMETPARRLLLYMYNDFFDTSEKVKGRHERGFDKKLFSHVTWNSYMLINAFGALERRATGINPILKTEVICHWRYNKPVPNHREWIDAETFRRYMDLKTLEMYPTAERYALDWGKRWFESFESAGWNEGVYLDCRFVDARLTETQLGTLDLMLESGSDFVRCYTRTEASISAGK